MLECKSEVPYVITLERELSQMPLKMRFLDVKQVREGELQYFYAVIANFRHARWLVEEGVRQNPAFVQNGENVAKTGQIGDIVSPFADLCCKIRCFWVFLDPLTVACRSRN